MRALVNHSHIRRDPIKTVAINMNLGKKWPKKDALKVACGVVVLTPGGYAWVQGHLTDVQAVL